MWSNKCNRKFAVFAIPLPIRHVGIAHFIYAAVVVNTAASAVSISVTIAAKIGKLLKDHWWCSVLMQFLFAEIWNQLVPTVFKLMLLCDKWICDKVPDVTLLKSYFIVIND